MFKKKKIWNRRSGKENSSRKKSSSRRIVGPSKLKKKKNRYQVFEALHLENERNTKKIASSAFFGSFVNA